MHKYSISERLHTEMDKAMQQNCSYQMFLAEQIVIKKECLTIAIEI